MGRAVALALVLLLALAVLRAVMRLGGRGARTPPGRPVLPTIRCAQCGVFVPSAQALREGEQAYCGERCARAARRGG